MSRLTMNDCVGSLVDSEAVEIVVSKSPVVIIARSAMVNDSEAVSVKRIQRWDAPKTRFEELF